MTMTNPGVAAPSARAGRPGVRGPASRTAASGTAASRTATAPPRARVRARSRLTEASLLRRGGVEPGADARTIAQIGRAHV